MRNLLVLHHTAGNPNRPARDDWETSKRWYQWIIDGQGVLHEFKDMPNQRTCGASYDISLSGDFTKAEPRPEQIKTLKHFLSTHSFEKIITHRELGLQGCATHSACPGNLVEYIMKKRVAFINEIGYNFQELPQLKDYFSQHIEWVDEGEAEMLFVINKSNYVGGDGTLRHTGSASYLQDGKWQSYDQYPTDKIAFLSIGDKLSGSWSLLDIAIHEINHLLVGETDGSTIHGDSRFYPQGHSTPASVTNELSYDVFKNAYNPAQHFTKTFIINPPNDMLTRKQVEQLYVLFGLGTADSEALDYWTGKELQRLLDARLIDLQIELDRVA